MAHYGWFRSEGLGSKTHPNAFPRGAVFQIIFERMMISLLVVSVWDPDVVGIMLSKDGKPYVPLLRYSRREL